MLRSSKFVKYFRLLTIFILGFLAFLIARKSNSRQILQLYDSTPRHAMVSSAKSRTDEEMLSGTSLMKSRKRPGVRTDPWGTPNMTTPTYNTSPTSKGTCLSRDLINEKMKWAQNVKEACNMAEYGKMSFEILENEYYRNIDLNNFIVDDKRKILYCVIPKAACTNTIKTMAATQDLDRISNKWKDKDKNLDQKAQREKVKRYISELPAVKSHNREFYRSVGLDYLTYTPRDQLSYKFKHYFKFMMVRNPYTRILSAFRDKFEKGYDGFYRKNYGVKIGKMYRKHYANLEGDDITFNEFVRYLTDTWTQGLSLERHWRPYYQLCHPCIIHYDLIAKVEDLNNDLEPFFDWISFNGTQSILSSKYGPQTNSSENASIKNYYKNISLPLLSKLSNVYDVDFKLFEYPIKLPM